MCVFDYLYTCTIPCTIFTFDGSLVQHVVALPFLVYVPLIDQTSLLVGRVFDKKMRGGPIWLIA